MTNGKAIAPTHLKFGLVGYFVFFIISLRLVKYEPPRALL